MATPYVAGVVALGLQAAPASSPAQVAAALEGAAVDRGLAGKDSEWGSGLVDAEAFVQRLTGAANQATTTFPTFSRTTGSVPTGGSTTFAVPVTDTSVPLAVTLTITSGSQSCLLFWPGMGCVWPGEWSPDLDAELRAPNGALVATSECALAGWLCTAVGRQETLLVSSPVVGSYSVRVLAWNGGPGGSFAADVSTGPLVGTTGPPPPPPANEPPTVFAGADQTITTTARSASVTLTGTATDPDGAIAARRWTNSTGKVLSTSSTLTQNLKRGSYVFTFSATDDDGATASDQVAVTVRRP
jgi:serine protease AprX